MSLRSEARECDSSSGCFRKLRDVYDEERRGLSALIDTILEVEARMQYLAFQIAFVNLKL